ncbi:MAG: hypothetical protein WC346_15505 [Methanogenium sp.]|jgi:hypothetical protein
MKGYPKHIGTKKDFENLLAMPEHRDKALKKLKEIHDLADDKVQETVSMTKDEETGLETAVKKEIDNPMPVYKIMGFKTRQEVSDLISAAEKEV